MKGPNTQSIVKTMSYAIKTSGMVKLCHTHVGAPDNRIKAL